jgi:hypothetical protein
MIIQVLEIKIIPELAHGSRIMAARLQPGPTLIIPDNFLNTDFLSQYTTAIWRAKIFRVNGPYTVPRFYFQPKMKKALDQILSKAKSYSAILQNSVNCLLI